MSRKNGIHLSTNDMVLTLMANGIEHIDSVNLANIIVLFPFNELDGLYKAIAIIKKGETNV
jgi:hypothetical protein